MYEYLLLLFHGPTFFKLESLNLKFEGKVKVFLHGKLQKSLLKVTLLTTPWVPNKEFPKWVVFGWHSIFCCHCC